jgi:hypothetical protein
MGVTPTVSKMAAPRDPPMLTPGSPSATTKRVPTRHRGASDPRPAVQSRSQAPRPRLEHCRLRPPASLRFADCRRLAGAFRRVPREALSAGVARPTFTAAATASRSLTPILKTEGSIFGWTGNRSSRSASIRGANVFFLH